MIEGSAAGRGARVPHRRHPSQPGVTQRPDLPVPRPGRRSAHPLRVPDHRSSVPQRVASGTDRGQPSGRLVPRRGLPCLPTLRRPHGHGSGAGRRPRSCRGAGRPARSCRGPGRPCEHPGPMAKRPGRTTQARRPCWGRPWCGHPRGYPHPRDLRGRGPRPGRIPAHRSIRRLRFEPARQPGQSGRESDRQPGQSDRESTTDAHGVGRADERPTDEPNRKCPLTANHPHRQARREPHLDRPPLWGHPGRPREGERDQKPEPHHRSASA